MARVLLEGVTKYYGNTLVLDALDLEVREGEFLSLLGPSGCGKTTALRLVAGFIEPTRGRILFDGEDQTFVEPERRGIGMVFQDYALFPHLTIAENIAFGLRERGEKTSAIKPRVAKLLELIQLPGIESRFPAELSGGQQQRVALARALAYHPRVLLMDEPLGALDLKLREAMQTELRRIQQELGITTLYVTHDQGEAIGMSDRIAVMNKGKVLQLGGPEEIYKRPTTRFVAAFVGKVNFLPARFVGMDGGIGVLECLDQRVAVANARRLAADQRVLLALRPEQLTIAAPAPGLNALPGRIVVRRFAGNILDVVVALGDGTRLSIEAREAELAAGVGDTVQVCWRPQDGSIIQEET